MKLAIVSDTHNRYATLGKALELIAAHRVDLILHCGDIEEPQVVCFFDERTHFVFGNCDDDKAGLRSAVASIGATLHEPYGALDLPGGPIAFVHGDNSQLLHQLEHSGRYRYLFHGHTHVITDRRTGPTRIINPGALHRATPKTFAVLDLATDELETVVVE